MKQAGMAISPGSLCEGFGLDRQEWENLRIHIHSKRNSKNTEKLFTSDTEKIFTGHRKKAYHRSKPVNRFVQVSKI